MEIVIALVLVALVVAFAAAPLWRPADDRRPAGEDPVLAELEARKESKYREIRDAELDREQGKLSEADWARADAALRREAIAILKEIDAHRARRGEAHDD